MRFVIAAVMLAASGIAAGQQVLEFRDDLRFSATEVDRAAARAFGARLRLLEVTGRLDPDPALKARLQALFPRLLRAAVYERPSAGDLAWEIHTCSRCDENAMAMPGGKLLVSSDFVRRLALTDDELAYLLAHEIAHILSEHTREFATVARYFVDNGLARSYVDIQHELGENLPLLLRMSAISAQQELDADYAGFILGAHAGFNPDAMLALLEKLQGGGTSIFATHPTDDRRMKQAREMLETARRLAARSAALP